MMMLLAPADRSYDDQAPRPRIRDLGVRPGTMQPGPLNAITDVPLFHATVEAVEEAVYNSLTRATSVTGHVGRTAGAIPIDALRKALQ